ncbi:MAG: hypothetical protein R6U26_00860 [Candidatus Undinarchaeales archaeon]
MEGDTILIISVFGSLIGIFILYFGVSLIEPELVALNKIDSEHIDEYVKIEGRVESIRKFGDSVLIQFETTDIVVFTPEEFASEVYTGAFISVKGIVKEYKGELEVVPNRPDEVQIK